MPAEFRPPSLVRKELSLRFPKLANIHWSIKSPWNDDYQCFAWAACRTNVLWAPVLGCYWPAGVDFNDSVEAFIQAFATIGYEPCHNSNFEFGYQKVAIYATNDRSVKHMARQHFFGRGWLSKCGSKEDILHADLECIEGDPSEFGYTSYGKVVQILKRSWWDAVCHLCLFRCILTSFKFWLYRIIHEM